jgi:transcription termination factor Rho
MSPLLIKYRYTLGKRGGQMAGNDMNRNDLEGKSIDDLRNMAKKMNMQNADSMSKGELVDAMMRMRNKQ